MTDKCGVSLPEITSAHAKRRRFRRRCVTFAAFSLSLSFSRASSLNDREILLFTIPSSRFFAKFFSFSKEFSIEITIVIISIFVRDGFDGSQFLFKFAI